MVEAREAIDKGVTLCGRYGTGYRDGVRVPASHLWRSDVKFSPYEKPTMSSLGGLTVSLVTGWGACYFHWLTEELTMLLCLDFKKIDHILIGKWYPPFAYESLDYLGLTKKIIKWEQGAVTVNLLSFGPQRVEGQGFGPGLEKLREAFKAEPNGPEKIFVKRDRAKERKLVNQVEWLEAHPDFKGLWPNGMTVLQQSAYFANAQVIAGPHGAGLTNMVWAKHCK